MSRSFSSQKTCNPLVKICHWLIDWTWTGVRVSSQFDERVLIAFHSLLQDDIDFQRNPIIGCWFYLSDWVSGALARHSNLFMGISESGCCLSISNTRDRARSGNEQSLTNDRPLSIHLHVENQQAFSSSIVILNDYTRTPYDYHWLDKQIRCFSQRHPYIMKQSASAKKRRNSTLENRLIKVKMLKAWTITTVERRDDSSGNVYNRHV